MAVAIIEARRRLTTDALDRDGRHVVSDSIFADDEIYLALPHRRSVIAVDARSLEPKRTYEVALHDAEDDPPESMSVVVAGSSVFVGSQYLESHAGDVSTVLHVFDREKAELRQVFEPESDGASRWAVSASGRALLVAAEREDKRGVLRVMAQVHRDAERAAALTFPVTPRDELDCDAVCLDGERPRAS